MRSHTKSLAKSMTVMGKIGESEIQGRLRNAAYLTALYSLATGDQTFLPDLRDWRFGTRPTLASTDGSTLYRR
jgi:hypothetical protein